MARTYPLETVFRCFVLYLDYVAAEEIGGHDDLPNAITVRRWAEAGEGTQGYPWEKIRQMTAATRAMVSYEREIGERTQLPWSEKVDEMEQDLIDLQDAIMEEMKSGGLQQYKAGDLARIMTVRQDLRNNTVERLQERNKFIRMVGAILKRRASELLEPNRAEQLLDLVAQDFMTAQATGANEEELRQITG